MCFVISLDVFKSPQGGSEMAYVMLGQLSIHFSGQCRHSEQSFGHIALRTTGARVMSFAYRAGHRSVRRAYLHF